MAAGPSSTSVCTAARSQRPSPAYRVSCSCSATSSSSLRATAIPPCAYSEEDSRNESFAMTRTVPAFASSIAARRPATPAPMTRKSQSIAIAILQCKQHKQPWGRLLTCGRLAIGPPGRRQQVNISKRLVVAVILAAGLLQAQTVSLAEKIQRLEDTEEIRTVLVNYGRTLDAHDFGAYSRLFAKDGEWIGGFGSVKGPAAIEAFMAKNIGTPGKPSGTYHALTNIITSEERRGREE